MRPVAEAKFLKPPPVAAHNALVGVSVAAVPNEVEVANVKIVTPAGKPEDSIALKSNVTGEVVKIIPEPVGGGPELAVTSFKLRILNWFVVVTLVPYPTQSLETVGNVWPPKVALVLVNNVAVPAASVNVFRPT